VVQRAAEHLDDLGMVHVGAVQRPGVDGLAGDRTDEDPMYRDQAGRGQHGDHQRRRDVPGAAGRRRGR
jgi:hypothetical protein